MLHLRYLGLCTTVGLEFMVRYWLLKWCGVYYQHYSWVHGSFGFGGSQVWEHFVEVHCLNAGLPIAPHGITLLEDRSTGRPNGDGFVEFINPEIVEKALEKHRDSIQHRYIEVYRSSLEELERYLRRAKRCSSPTRGQVDMIRENSPDTRRNQDSYRGPVIRDDRSRRGGPLIRDKRTQNRQVDVRSGLCVYLRGLPFSATKRDVEEFLEPAVPNKVVIELTNGRPNGNAIVSLSNQRDVNICLRKHRLNMGSRYIEVLLRGSAAV